MFLATINKPKQLLRFDFIGQVRAEELANGRPEVAALIEELGSGFRVLGDFTHLDAMSVGCAAEIGKTMELCEQNGVALVVRVMPDHWDDSEASRERASTMAAASWAAVTTMNEFIYRDIPNLPSQDDVIAACAKKGDKIRQLTYLSKDRKFFINMDSL